MRRNSKVRKLILAALFSAPVAAQPALGQNESVLRQAFEGKTVTVKIDMPATSRGVDVYPLEAMAVDFREVAQRLKDNSTALRIGQQVMVTKVVVKKNSHIEFQLGGGGYGTFGQARAGSHEAKAVRARAGQSASGTRA